jgi:hypothetical protein
MKKFPLPSLLSILLVAGSCYRVTNSGKLETRSPQGTYQLSFKKQIHEKRPWEYRVFLTALANGNKIIDDDVWQVADDGDQHCGWDYQKTRFNWKSENILELKDTSMPFTDNQANFYVHNQTDQKISYLRININGCASSWILLNLKEKATTNFTFDFHAADDFIEIHYDVFFESIIDKNSKSATKGKITFPLPYSEKNKTPLRFCLGIGSDPKKSTIGSQDLGGYQIRNEWEPYSGQNKIIIPKVKNCEAPAN